VPVPFTGGAEAAAIPVEPPDSSLRTDDDTPLPAGSMVVRAATWVQRVGAGAVDFSVCVGLTLGYAVVEALDIPAEPSQSALVLTGVDRALDVMSRYAAFLLSMLVALGVATLLYEGLSVALMGRTLGQKLMGVRLLHRSGARPGLIRALARGTLSGLGFLLLGAGWLWSPFDRRRAGLHDRWTRLDLVEDPLAPAPLPPVEGTPSDPPAADPPTDPSSAAQPDPTATGTPPPPPQDPPAASA
jgi:hypothetical protein